MKTDYDYKHIAVAYQGGGSLGAYHIGALEAMQQDGYKPDVVAGISIGAFTAAIVAGNEPDTRVKKLREFWETISWPDFPAVTEGEGWMRKWHNQLSSWQGFIFGQPDFFKPRPFPAPLFQTCGTAAATSYYDTTPLIETLSRVVDFERINRQKTRLILGTTRVRDGEPAWFDNFTQNEIGPNQVLASGAMPPGFPGIRIDGDLYWDGGCYSNTPLEGIYDALRDDGDTLCFVIDLFGPNGREPQDMGEVQLTMKEIQFSNRIKNRIRSLCERHNYAHLLRYILEKHPEAIRDHPQREEIRELTKVGRFDIIHILYQKPGTEVATCDCEFSKSSIEYRRQQGYSDMKKALADRAQRFVQRRLARKISPVGTVVETFCKGTLVKSSLDLAAAMPSEKQIGSVRPQDRSGPQIRKRSTKVSRLNSPPNTLRRGRKMGDPFRI
jgi:NTE family protein